MSDVTSRLVAHPLSDKDDVSAFDSGPEPWAVDVSEFLRDDALDQQEKGLNKTQLFSLDNEVVGFVSLLASSIQLRKYSELPDGIVGYSTIPAVLFARFGVDAKHQHRGIGSAILAWTRYEVSELSIGVRFISLDCDPDNPALDLYKHNDFFEADSKPDKRTGMLTLVYDMTSSVS